jgi:hypothetical protein
MMMALVTIMVVTPAAVPIPMLMVMPVAIAMTMPGAMIVPVPMMMVMAMIMSAVIRLERRRHFRSLQPMLRDQRFDFGLFLQPDPVGKDLHRDVTVAERDEEARDRSEILGEILGAHLDHRLDVGHDFHDTAVVEHQQVVGM